MNTLYELPTAGSSSQPYLPSSRDHGFKHTPSKIFDNLKRTLTPGKGSRPQGERVEVDPGHAHSRSRYLQEDSAARPTVEQIAMGLHLSRTPHLPPHMSPHPSSTHHRLARVETTPSPLARRHSYSHRPHSSLVLPSRVVPPLPPPPSRPALKPSRHSAPSSSSPKASLQTLDSGSTPPSSVGPRTPSSHSPARRLSRLSRFARGIVHGGSGSRFGSNSQSTSEVSVALSEPTKKAVRFEGYVDPADV